MTGTEKIKSKILEDARAKASDIEEQARAEAREILSQASGEAGRKREEILKKAEADGQEAYRRLLSVAGLEGRKEVLRAKQDMVEAAFQKAMDKVTQLPDNEYQKLIEEMVIRAATKGTGEIVMSEKDSKRMNADFLNNINKRLKASGINGSLTLSKDHIKTAGGFILRSVDMEVNSTLEILFGMLRPELETTW